MARLVFVARASMANLPSDRGSRADGGTNRRLDAMSDPQPRMTQTTQAVLRAMLDDPTSSRYGLEICGATGLPSGTVHPILARLESIGWVQSSWEEVDPREEGRPRRRYYRLTGDGLVSSREALARAYESRTRIVSRLRPAGEAV